jgi:hypothetical protein
VTATGAAESAAFNAKQRCAPRRMTNGPRRGPFAWGMDMDARDSASFVVDESGQEVEPLDYVPD